MKTDKPMNIAFLSTYPPRECGIASFTQDLVLQLQQFPATVNTRVIAVGSTRIPYDKRVMMELEQNDRKGYAAMARKINLSGIDLLVIEHEYDIYGGIAGEYLMDLVNLLEIPFITTFHTVLALPNERQRKMLHELGEKSEKVITMAQNSVALLTEVYSIDPLKIEVIHYGVPEITMKPREVLKKESGIEGRSIVSTFGLLSPGKGIEFGIEAIARVAQTYPEVLYFIMGQTHPSVMMRSGEIYRKSLEAKVNELGINGNVRFINKYLTKREIIRCLKMSDVYMTPYLKNDQAVSGTLAYAAGYGRVIVSTPFSYAKEMLSGGRGLLTEFGDAESIADQINYVLSHPDEKSIMEQKTLAVGENMMWHIIAKKYKELFSNILKHRNEAQVIA